MPERMTEFVVPTQVLWGHALGAIVAGCPQTKLHLATGHRVQ
jgi:hypothetical protein